MTASTTVTLSDDERAVCGSRADVLIPHAAGMPSASEMDVHTIWIDQALHARPDLADRFHASLAEGAGQPAEAAVESIHRHRPELFDAFSLLVAGAYLMNPVVRQLIGYPGQEDRPVTGDEVDTYIQLLEPVAERGPVYRPTV